MKSYFQSLNILSEEELHLLEGITSSKQIKKGSFLIQEGEVCKEVVFIRSGILRSFFTKPNGEEVTYCLTFGNNLMTALSSLIEEKPTHENIQALTDLELEVIKKSDLNKLVENNFRWMKVVKILVEQQYIELENRMLDLQRLDAKERYEKLINEREELVRYIPLKHLASFLNITPRHLSRLRADFQNV
ncbi:Crp/Fnr family transcriptional regulator [Marivirga sp. S37H4]|uniref:Crp/Fnr family transcriptional regulator n=1 Tax=Marivirga aurantiaca TaxID=2802615 RepID=A0A934WYP0_9BACT|nr:Crp/Fnr family transcriptional regulator [Marivirga aurantiaca]MBK6265623.1 Crp/Fnr family transcriptional regulator [Marivirga aurantiaca]